MDFEELKNLLQKSYHTEEERSKILGQSRFTCVSAKDWTALERSDLVDSRIPSGSVDAEPPLSALLYAAQGILHPTLSFRHIPDLLDILSQVERAREFSLEHAKWALIWQRFYETRPSSRVRVLRKSDKEAIKKLLKPERLDATRCIFIFIIEQAIRVHVLYLWTHAEESYRLHHYLQIYFPWAHSRHDSQRLYHALLAPDEQVRLAEVGMSCFRFMRDAKFWEEQRLRELDVSSLPDSYYGDDESFQVLKFKFIGNLEIVDIVDSITLYLKKVRGLTQKLEGLLAHHVP
ncbi:hypothetical protein EDB92DRAFT_1951045 [Lactarius akahatsu]|uniref:Uncharacterized protein n=1 Tax=Lactarius akahatsu TaxID=416441 RepID=A0AAD4L950_9AGAM|nr:hypothetical protein EDB92DRAFT_1951045 [Lactarius akahatsu]